ncbi:CRAL-TRIO domain-containing protein [Trichonephila clavipes]|nr:CRAL-TRIO domain-containing protein [Trichonephila clavipes]
MRDPVTQVTGFNAIHDFSNTGIRHLRYCTLSNLLLLHHVAFDCIPGRYLEVHCINGNILLSTMLTLFKPFMSEMLRKMLYFHSSPEELLKYFPPEVLPVKYGGTLSDYYMADWLKKANEQHEDLTVKALRHNYQCHVCKRLSTIHGLSFSTVELIASQPFTVSAGLLIISQNNTDFGERLRIHRPSGSFDKYSLASYNGKLSDFSTNFQNDPELTQNGCQCGR